MNKEIINIFVYKNTAMKNLFKVFGLLFLLLNVFLMNAQKVSDSSEKSGFLLKSENPEYKIVFPTAYKLEESKTDKGLKTEFYRAVKDDNIYMFKFTEHKNPAVSSDNKVYLEASLESFINGIKADLIKKYEFKEKKQKGLEAFLTIPDKNLNVFYRVVIVKHVQYQIIVITKSKEKTAEISKFFNSFEVR